MESYGRCWQNVANPSQPMPRYAKATKWRRWFHTWKLGWRSSISDTLYPVQRSIIEHMHSYFIPVLCKSTYKQVPTTGISWNIMEYHGILIIFKESQKIAECFCDFCAGAMRCLRWMVVLCKRSLSIRWGCTHWLSHCIWQPALIMEVYGGRGYDINSMETRALHVVPWISMGAVGAQTSNSMVSNS